MNTVINEDRYMTLGQLVAEIRNDGLNVTESQVKYAIKTSSIQPAGRVGIIRIWSPDILPTLRAALKRIAERRSNSQ